jgi:hypothetical protein
MNSSDKRIVAMFGSVGRRRKAPVNLGHRQASVASDKKPTPIVFLGLYATWRVSVSSNAIRMAGYGNSRDEHDYYQRSHDLHGRPPHPTIHASTDSMDLAIGEHANFLAALRFSLSVLTHKDVLPCQAIVAEKRSTSRSARCWNGTGSRGGQLERRSIQKQAASVEMIVLMAIAIADSRGRGANDRTHVVLAQYCT